MSGGYVTDITAEHPLLIGKTGFAALPPTTLPLVIQKCCSTFAENVALRVKRGGLWVEWTYAQYYQEINRCAKSFIAMGLQEKQAVMVIGFNSPEWFMACLGSQFAGGVIAGIYTTNEPDMCQKLAIHCKPPIVILEDNTQLAKFLMVKEHLPFVKHYVVWGEEPTPGSGAITWSDMLKLGHEVPDSAVQDRVDSIKPGHCATLIYTSGTTGDPKAVMLSHDACTWTVPVVMKHQGLIPGKFHCGVSYLPLSHIAAQMIDIFAVPNFGGTISFAAPDALKGSLVHTLKEVKPTLFFGVPRVWEKMEEKMLEVGRATTGMKKKIATLAKSIGAQAINAERDDAPVPWGTWFLQKTIFAKIREALGFDRCEIMCAGAAPVEAHTHEYFQQFMFPILEFYGMSETTGVISQGTLKKWKCGTVGIVPEGVEVKLDKANPTDEEGEICVRARCVMMGYMNNEEATKETFDADGFLKTGDIGKFDSEGFLKITGRIKELIITAGGENIPPVIIEGKIKEELPALSNVMVIGDRKKYLSAFITIKCEVVDQVPTNNLAGVAKDVNPAITTSDEAVNDPVWQKYIEAGIKRANARAESNAQRIQKFKILPNDFTHLGADAELGPTLKLMRRKVVAKYEKEIDDLYPENH